MLDGGGGGGGGGGGEHRRYRTDIETFHPRRIHSLGRIRDNAEWRRNICEENEEGIIIESKKQI